MLSRAVVAALALLSGVCGQNLRTFAPVFKDPFTQNAALLELNVFALRCAGVLKVDVHLPQAFDETEATATLMGDTFAPVRVNGFTTQHNDPINHPRFATRVTVGWNNADKILTFTDFEDVAATPTVVGGEGGWTNINFLLPASLFEKPNPALPLELTALPLPPNAPQEPNRISLIKDKHFKVTQIAGQGCGHGDPVFAGFQGQNYQFHGLPDEHFNLVSSPNVTLNSHFVYLASGKCDYTDTECWTHPGTYMDVLGFQIADSHIKLIAGTHEAGLRIWVDDIELTRGERATDFNATGFVHYHHNGRVDVETDIMNFHIVNSDMFMNLQVSLKNPELLRVGAAKHTITDKALCKANSETSHHQLVESIVAAKYPVNTPLHGLIGQTWRNVKVCGNDWMGTTEDYLVSDLFANDNHYNYFRW